MYELLHHQIGRHGLTFERYPFFWLARFRAWTLPNDSYASITERRGRDIIWRRNVDR